MKRYHLAALLLWIIVYGTTILLIRDKSVLKYLSPVFLFAMIGNIQLISQIYRDLQ